MFSKFSVIFQLIFSRGDLLLRLSLYLSAVIAVFVFALGFFSTNFLDTFEASIEKGYFGLLGDFQVQLDNPDLLDQIRNARETAPFVQSFRYEQPHGLTLQAQGAPLNLFVTLLAYEDEYLQQKFETGGTSDDDVFISSVLGKQLGIESENRVNITFPQVGDRVPVPFTSTFNVVDLGFFEQRPIIIFPLSALESVPNFSFSKAVASIEYSGLGESEKADVRALVDRVWESSSAALYKVIDRLKLANSASEIQSTINLVHIVLLSAMLLITALFVWQCLGLILASKEESLMILYFVGFSSTFVKSLVSLVLICSALMCAALGWVISDEFAPLINEYIGVK